MGNGRVLRGLLAATLILSAAGLRVDSGIHFPKSYYIRRPPDAGDMYVDPVFGTAVLRLTDALSMSYERLTPEYPQSSPCSLDCKWFLLKSNGGVWHLFDGDGNYVRELYGVNEPRWSRTNPDLFYFPINRAIKSYNVPTDVRSNVRVLTQYATIGFGRGQSDLSDNERTTIIADDRYVFLYDLSSDTPFAAVDTLGHPFDFASPTPDGDGFIISWLQRGTTRWTGVELFDVNGNFQRQLLNAGAHGDMGRDVSGMQVYFQSNAATSPSQPPGWGKAVVKVRLSDGEITGLFPLAEALSMHMSARSGDGWVYVSTYDWTNPVPTDRWFPYSNEIVRVRADGSVVERLVHHRSRANTYWRTPRAAVSIDGTKLLYASDFHLTGKPYEYVDTYVIDIPLLEQARRPHFIAEATTAPRRLLSLSSPAARLSTSVAGVETASDTEH